MEIKVLSVNSVFREQLLAEHGLALWLEYQGNKYLFDTGSGYVLKHNADTLNIDFNNLDGVILSHNHYDHTGGLFNVLEVNPEVEVYGHPDTIKDIKKYNIKLKPVIKKTEISQNLWMTGQLSIDMLNISKKNKYIEQIKTENSLYVETNKGLVVLLGCSHSGLINILKHIKETSKKNIYAVIGGMHLINKTEQELNKIISELKKLKIDLFYPLHCTGYNATIKLKENFNDRVSILRVGDTVKF